MTMSQIEQKIANQIKIQLGVSVEFTNRGDGQWTICAGLVADVEAVVGFMAQYLGWKLEDPIEFDAECECAFAYMEATQ